MSSPKRALIVDDSKSARVVLRRMLERHALSVDAVESGQLALDYLQTTRPDVIFLDHMMPGMDGFQAIRAIKNNPDTATIPVLMYTSKGGDLYVSQARALGAVDVLPKTIAPGELFDALQNLGLVEDRRSEESPDGEEIEASERAVDLRRRSEPPLPFLEPGMRRAAAGFDDGDTEIWRRLLDEQRVEIRKDVLVGMETLSRQVGTRMARELEEHLQSLQPGLASRSRLHTWLLPLLLSAALILSLLGNLLWHPSHHREAPQAVAADPEPAEPATRQVASAAPAVPPAESAPDWGALARAVNQTVRYPFDQVALDGERLDTVRGTLELLVEAGYRGTLVVRTLAGEFCLTGDNEQGFSLPSAELTIDDCDFIGNPVQPADVPAAHQSLRFANFVNSSPLLDDTGIELEVVALPRREPAVDYPPREAQTTSETWNAAAAANNRISIELAPQDGTP